MKNGAIPTTPQLVVPTVEDKIEILRRRAVAAIRRNPEASVVVETLDIRVEDPRPAA
ncbi:MAG: hypothetical protein OXI71_00770 [Gemmatimonadota bacterium]|nr:hypothetical protein [Gemmatimonadota bacterium]